MSNIDVREFGELFEPLITQSDSVVWVTKPDYSKQIYISPSFEEIWQVSCQEQKHNTKAWSQSLLQSHQSSWYDKTLKRMPGLQKDNTVRYAIRNAKDQENIYIKDTSFYLYDDDKHVATAGICQPIPERQWLSESQNRNHSNPELLIHDFKGAIETLNLKPINPNDSPHQIVNHALKTISPKQLECLYLVKMGFPAKKIAQQLNRSVRTIEKHIDALRAAFGCKNKVELALQFGMSEIELALQQQQGRSS